MTFLKPNELPITPKDEKMGSPLLLTHEVNSVYTSQRVNGTFGIDHFFII